MRRPATARLAFLAGLGLAGLACAQPIVFPTPNLHRPTAVAVAARAGAGAGDPEFAYVLGSERAEVSVLDLRALTLLDLEPGVPGFTHAQVGGRPVDLAASPDGKSVYVTDFARGQVHRICTPIDPSCTAHRVTTRYSVLPGIERILVAVEPGGTLEAGSAILAYITRPHDGEILIYDLTGSGNLRATVRTGGEPRALAMTEGTIYAANSAGTAIFRIQRASLEVTSIEIGGASREISVSPAGDFLYAVLTSRPAVAAVDLAQGSLVNVGAAIGSTEPGITLPAGIPRSVVFFTVTAADASPLGLVGNYAYVLASDGNAYMVGLPGCAAGAIACDAHLLVDGNPASPSVTLPVLRLNDTPQPPTDQFPRFQGFEGGPPFGISIVGARGVVKTEAWTVAFEGVLPGVNPSAATAVNATDIENPAVDFAAKGVVDGDRLVILDAPLPSGAEACAAAIAPEPTGCESLRGELSVSLLPESKSRLRVAVPGAEAGKSLACCYRAPFRYEVRAPGRWVVSGTLSGYQGRADTGLPHQNRVLAFTLLPATGPGAKPLQRGLSWSFSIFDGVTPVKFAAGDLPERGVRAKTTNTLLFTDASGEQILHVSPAQNGILRIFR